jgi:hypothetical protein
MANCQSLIGPGLLSLTLLLRSPPPWQAHPPQFTFTSRLRKSFPTTTKPRAPHFPLSFVSFALSHHHRHEQPLRESTQLQEVDLSAKRSALLPCACLKLLLRVCRISPAAARMTTNLAMHTKVTSPGSQYSVSAAGDVTVPNPTPLSEALDNEVVDPPPEMDFFDMCKAVNQSLAPIAEKLNEEAEEAMYPTPPINTPEVTSPATSIVQRHSYRHESDAMSVSAHSARSSIPASHDSDAGSSDHLCDRKRDDHASKFVTEKFLTMS